MQDSASDRTHGYHLFLKPVGPVAAELQETIQKLATEYGTPVFPPHVTLLAQISDEDESTLIEKLRTLSGTVPPFSLTLGAYGMQDSFFRALYATVAPSAELTLLHEHAEKLLLLPADEHFMPHLSLLYGNFDTGKKREILRTLPPLSGTAFEISSLYLYKTEGTAPDWFQIAEFPFS